MHILHTTSNTSTPVYNLHLSILIARARITHSRAHTRRPDPRPSARRDRTRARACSGVRARASSARLARPRAQVRADSDTRARLVEMRRLIEQMPSRGSSKEAPPIPASFDEQAMRGRSLRSLHSIGDGQRFFG